MGTAVPTVCFFLAGCNLRRYYDDRSGYCGSRQDSDLFIGNNANSRCIWFLVSETQRTSEYLDPFVDCVGVTDDVSDHNPGYSGNVDACPASLSSHWSRSTKPDSLCDHDAGKERESTETVKRRSRLKVQDLETEEFPEEEPADFQEEPVETEKYS